MEFSGKKMHLEEGVVTYIPQFLSKIESKRLFNALIKRTEWQSDKIKIFGKTYDIPRLQAWHGDPEATYTYSNIELTPLPWTIELQNLKEKIELNVGASFNSVLLNLYRNGQDSNGWHSDDEEELGSNPVIASISLGEARKFKMKHKSKPLKWDIILESGSLLIMEGKTQHYWKHQIPKSQKVHGPRINLTFRRIFT